MAAFKEIMFIAAEKTLLIIYKGKRIQFTSDKKEFSEIKELLRQRDEEAIIKKITKGASFMPVYSNGLFAIQDDELIELSTGSIVEKRLGKKILEWAEDGLPFEPLLEFHKKTIDNPSRESVNDLYAFLENNKIPITNEGNFIAYKKVTRLSSGKLVDTHTKTIPNDVGLIVKMDRKGVDPDRNNDCSNGFHVAGWSYMEEFNGDVILEVEVDPVDVVAVPKDYNRAKMRVCKYKIIAEVNSKGERMEKFVKVVKKEETETNISANIEGVDFASMTANEIKKYILDSFNVTITTDNKNKQSIIKQANKIFAERK